MYRALDRELNRTVAVKIIRPEFAADLSSLLRLKREVVLASRVGGNHVVRVHDFGEVDGQALIAMDWVDGENLAALLARVHTLPPSQVCVLGAQICAALRDIHAANIVHRDLKPGNLLINRCAEVLVADFGLARSALPQEGSLSFAGESCGTPRYMSPEQLAGLPADTRSDLYSFGMVLLEMLTGVTALEALEPLRERWILSPGEKHIRSGELRKLAALDLVIRRCLQLDRTERYADVEAVLRDLRLADVEIPATHPLASVGQASFRLRRSAIAGIASALLLAAVLSGLHIARKRPVASSAQLYARAISLVTPGSNETDLRLAAQTLTEALAQSPNYLPALRARLDVSLRLYQSTADPRSLVDAREALPRATAAGLDKSQGALYLAKIDLYAGLYSAVIHYLEKDAALLASSADANRLLGRALEASGRPSEALSCYRAAIRLSPVSWLSHNDLASILLDMGRPEEASQQFLEVIRLNPESSAGYSNLGLALLDSGELENAQKSFETALERQPASETYFNLGLTTYYSQRYASALPFFQSAIQMRPQSERYVAALADAQRHAGQKSLARETYTRVLSMLDNLERTRKLNTHERCRRALCFLGLGDFGSANAAVDLLEQSGAQDQMVYYTAAVLAVVEGRFIDARKLMAKAFLRGYPAKLAKMDPDLRGLF